MTNEEAIEILRIYKQRLDESCSNLLGNDKEAFDLAIKALAIEPSSCELMEFGKCSYKETGCSDCYIKARIRRALDEKCYDIGHADGARLGYEKGLKDARPKGKWVHENDDHYDWYVCSHCGYGDEGEVTDNLSAYCPCCGADMRSVDEGLHERAVSDLSKTVDDLYKKLRGEEA